MNLKKVPTQDLVVSEHGPVFNYFMTMKNHFMQIMGLNILFVVFNIPMMLVAFAYVLYFLPLLNPVFTPDNFVAFMNEAGVVGNDVMNDVGNDAIYQIYYLIVVFCVMFLMGTCLLCIGPFQAGFSQIYRNIYRQQGVFFFSDFKEGLRKNWKQSLIASVISLIVTALMLTGISFYINIGSKAGTVIATLFVVGFFAFILIQNMVYQMIVSVDLPLHKIYRNAFLFLLLKLGPCLAFTGIQIVMLVIVPFALLMSTTYFAYALVIFYYITVIFGVLQYMLAFATGEFINQYIVAPASSAEDEADPEEDAETDGGEDAD